MKITVLFGLFSIFLIGCGDSSNDKMKSGLWKSKVTNRYFLQEDMEVKEIMEVSETLYCLSPKFLADEPYVKPVYKEGSGCIDKEYEREKNEATWVTYCDNGKYRAEWSGKVESDDFGTFSVKTYFKGGDYTIVEVRSHFVGECEGDHEVL